MLEKDLENYFNHKFELGENHFRAGSGCTEDNIMYDYPIIVHNELTIYLLYSELIKKSILNKTYIENLVNQLIQSLQNFDIENISNLSFSNFKLKVKEGDYVESFIYNPLTKVFNITLNRKCLIHLKNSENIINIIKTLKGLENNNNLIKSKIDVDEIKKQKIEVDKLARRCGFKLRKLYKENSTENILRKVFALKLEDKELEKSLIDFFDTSIYQSLFLRNLYDYINQTSNFV